jgi:hypothetical protein
MSATVGELKAALADYPDDLLLILQKDSEGNGYSPLAGAARGLYDALNTWSGECYEPRDQVDDPDDEAPSSAVDAVILWPVH